MAEGVFRAEKGSYRVTTLGTRCEKEVRRWATSNIAHQDRGRIDSSLNDGRRRKLRRRHRFQNFDTCKRNSRFYSDSTGKSEENYLRTLSEIYNIVRWAIVRLECLFYETSEITYRALSERHGRNSKIFASYRFASVATRTHKDRRQTWPSRETNENRREVFCEEGPNPLRRPKTNCEGSR